MADYSAKMHNASKFHPNQTGGVANVTSSTLHCLPKLTDETNSQ